MRMVQSEWCILAMILIALTFHVSGETVLVSIQSQSQDDMDKLTAKIDEQTAGSGAQRVTLGAIEATMSRVVDVESPYLVTVPQSVPTLSLLGDIAFDSVLQTWKMTYETMRIDPSAQINDFSRVLYFTKQNVVAGDVRNPCLVAGVDDAQCLRDLAVDYGVPGDAVPTTGTDYLVHDGSTVPDCLVCSIQSTVTDIPHSARQKLELVIPHELVRNVLTKRTTHLSPLTGERVQYSFGIGMLFVSEGNNMVIFDEFDVIENSHDQVAISKLNTYAVARHVSFWTAVADQYADIRIATVEYLLDKGQDLVGISAALNGRPINATDCSVLQAKIDSLPDPLCITQHQLCVPNKYQSGSGASLQTWATYVIPLPTWHTSNVYKINTLLTTNDTVTNTKILSTLNFETTNEPQLACENSKGVDFNPMQYVVAELFRGHELQVEQIKGSFTVSNKTAFSMAESLMTVVLRPADTDAAAEYFDTYTDEELSLDQLYMSHAIHSTIVPDTVTNKAVGIANGRSELELDQSLIQSCPMETQEVYYDSNLECVTTHDWGINGAVARPISTSESATCPHCQYFVRQVGLNVADDLAWLRSNIFGSSDPGVEVAFYSQLSSLVPNSPRNLAKHAKTYWVWPLYHWPGRAPIGLKDKTIVSLSWSIVKS